MKILHVLLAASVATCLYAKDVKPNPIEAKVDAMIAESKKAIKSVEPRALMDMIKAEKDFVLIDIREPAEVGAGKIDTLDYKAFPSGVLPFKIKAFKTDKHIVIYCKKGGRGALATKLVQDLGYKNVYNLKGGITGWLEAGYPVDSKLGSLVLKK